MAYKGFQDIEDKLNMHSDVSGELEVWVKDRDGHIIYVAFLSDFKEDNVDKLKEDLL